MRCSDVATSFRHHSFAQDVNGFDLHVNEDEYCATNEIQVERDQIMHPLCCQWTPSMVVCSIEKTLRHRLDHSRPVAAPRVFRHQGSPLKPEPASLQRMNIFYK
ncbi:hypothetical protein B0T14DRAFT_121237 [Immersiella caudata]|uniref:Uncharacterized protein n=1 Tax=Immersiella caudata TaxID=314043 RepID=A0AA39X452_9PEZI|nr:hypothetical protein B0T14DRAFT_121237 [Immersiella caudata]